MSIKGNPAFRQIIEDIGSCILTNALKLSLGVTDQWSSGQVAIFIDLNLYFF